MKRFIVNSIKILVRRQQWQKHQQQQQWKWVRGKERCLTNNDERRRKSVDILSNARKNSSQSCLFWWLSFIVKHHALSIRTKFWCAMKCVRRCSWKPLAVCCCCCCFWWWWWCYNQTNLFSGERRNKKFSLTYKSNLHSTKHENVARQAQCLTFKCVLSTQICCECIEIGLRFFPFLFRCRSNG